MENLEDLYVLWELIPDAKDSNNNMSKFLYSFIFLLFPFLCLVPGLWLRMSSPWLLNKFFFISFTVGTKDLFVSGILELYTHREVVPDHSINNSICRKYVEDHTVYTKTEHLFPDVALKSNIFQPSFNNPLWRKPSSVISIVAGRHIIASNPFRVMPLYQCARVLKGYCSLCCIKVIENWSPLR